jgi:hypothetical protein
MMGVASTAVGREAGCGLLALANLITVVAPIAADWNDTHIFNQRWPSHAGFHGVVARQNRKSNGEWAGGSARRSVSGAGLMPVGCGCDGAGR